MTPGSGDQQATDSQNIPREPTLPSGTLIDPANREYYNNICAPLYKALIDGDWKAAKVIINGNEAINGERLLGCAITEKYETALHIAVSAKNSDAMEKFVKYLVDDMTKKELAFQNIRDNTALCLAAISGNVKIARHMVDKHDELLDIPGYSKRTPLFIACLYGQSEIAQYLYEKSNKMTRGTITDEYRGLIFELCVESDLFDLALKILDDIPALATHGNVLRILARKTDALRGIERNCISRFFRRIFAIIGPAEKPSDAMELLTEIWKNIVKLPKEKIVDIIKGPAVETVVATQTTAPAVETQTTVPAVAAPAVETAVETQTTAPAVETAVATAPAVPNTVVKYPKRVLFVAAEMGNTEFVVQLIGRYPDLIRMFNDDKESIFHVAVSHRQEGVYNLLYEIGLRKIYLTPLANLSGDNMLHLAAKRAKIKQVPQDASGVAQQLQTELSWFKEVEAMVPAPYRQRKNKDGLTPYELFTKEHKEQISAGEKWMKDTAGQSLVVAALIATMVFPAAITVPGGNNGDGVPTFLDKQSFKVFVMSDAISLTFAIISILIFLSILTSHFLEQNFSTLLPRSIMIGLVTLFLSISAMLVSFCSSFFLHYQNNYIWIPITISIMAGIAVVLYFILLFAPLSVGYHSKYGSKNRFKLKNFKVDQIPVDEVGPIVDPPAGEDQV